MNVFSDDTDSVIARDVPHAVRLLKRYGRGDVDPECLDRVPNEHLITIHCDAAGVPASPGDPGVAPITRTAAEWVAARGPGFLCTTET